MSIRQFSDKYDSLFSKKFGHNVLFNEKLAPYLAYGVGGPADILVFPQNEDDLAWIGQKASDCSIPVTIIGNGTNLLVKDAGIRGITVSLSQAFQQILVMENTNSNPCVTVRVGGGVPKEKLLNWAVNNALTGLEFSAGVPGTVGGGIFMNAGTKYGCYADILREVRLFDFAKGGATHTLSEFHFSYRESFIKNRLVVFATFALKRGKKEVLSREITRIISERTEKQPLDFPSCGSTFKNPEGLSAGRLMERAGLKGLSVGGAEISKKHANFILNKGNASASDILKLINIARNAVSEKFGISLETEVVILGE